MDIVANGGGGRRCRSVHDNDDGVDDDADVLTLFSFFYWR